MTIAEQAGRASLDSTMVGQVVASRRVEVDFRSAALYAAAIGAERDLYLDDRMQTRGMAPPAFVISLEWPLVSGPELLAAIGVAPADLFPRLLHMYQDSMFAQPIRPGDQLMLDATLESVSATRTGAVIAVRIRTVNARTGGVVAESWFGGYFRDMTVHRPRIARAPPTIAASLVKEAISRETITISRGQSHLYDECARLRNPIHTDLSFASRLGLPDIALHGSLLWAKISEIVIDRYCGSDPVRLRRLAAQFRRPLHPNRAIAIETSRFGERDSDVAFALHDDQSRELLIDGVAQVDGGR